MSYAGAFATVTSLATDRRMEQTMEVQYPDSPEADLARLKQFARDTARINPNLLADVQSGLVKPCRMLSEQMDEFYGVAA